MMTKCIFNYSYFLLDMDFSISFPAHSLQSCAIPLGSFEVTWGFPVGPSHLQFKSMYSIRFNRPARLLHPPWSGIWPVPRSFHWGSFSSLNSPQQLLKLFSGWNGFHHHYIVLTSAAYLLRCRLTTAVKSVLRFLPGGTRAAWGVAPGAVFQMSLWWEAQLPPSSPCFTMALVNDPQEPRHL